MWGNASGIYSRHYSRLVGILVLLEQAAELFLCDVGLLQNAGFEQAGWHIAGVHRNGYAEFWAVAVQEPCVADGLMMNVKSSTQERGDNFFGAQDREPRHLARAFRR